MVERFVTRLSIAILIAGCAGVSASARAGVINGDFSSGNSGFTSGYTFGSTTGGGHYTVGNNPKSWNSFLSAYGDHTTGTGLMMIVDGSGTANTPVWTESLAVTPNTAYTFSFWAASCGNDNANGIDPSPAILVAKDNGTTFGSVFHVLATNGVWSQFTGTFNSGANTAVSLSITDSNTNGGAGNDLTIDDVALVPEPGTCTLLLLAGCAPPFWRRRRQAPRL